MQFSPGDRVDHYTLLEPLGEGGQGAVWKVLDPREGGVMRALKLIALAETGSAAFDRARREARILAAAKHPALVTCHSLFEEPGAGLVGLVMDLVHGGSLADAVGDGRLDRARSLAVLAQIADVLAYIHGAGLAHRDLKPENILLTDGFWEDAHRPGSVKLVDFGIAATAGSATKLTAPGAVIGTMPYLAPELVDPASWGRGDGPARDVFALGVLGCQLVLGKHPTGLRFDAAIIDFARAYKAAQVGRIAWPPQVLDGAWGAALSACLTLRPADRPASGAAILALLRTGAPPPSRRASWSGASGPTSTHHAPPRVGSSEPRSARAATPQAAGSTEPMGAPAQQIRTIPAAPAQQQIRTIPAAPVPGAFKTPPSRPHPRPRSGAGFGLLMLVFLGTCAGVVGIGYQADWIGLVPAPSSHTPTTATQTLPSAQAAATTTTAVASPATLGACCPLGKSCTGPTTLPREQCLYHCVGDAPALMPGASWQLRVIDAMVHEASIVAGHPNAKLEMRVGGSTQLLRFSQMSEGPEAERRLPVTTKDINGKGVHFKITDGETILADGPGRVKGTSVRASALCAGLYVYVDSPDGESIRLSVYLDP